MPSSENLIDDQIDKKEGEMSFLDHLEELRWRLIYAIIGIIIGTIITWIFIDQLVNFILLKPARDAGAELQNLKPFGQIFLFVQVAIVAGIVLSIPNTFYQLWKFISPALKKTEKKYAFSIVFFSTVCFLSGLVFAYFILLPLAMAFVTEFGAEEIKNNFAINEYLNIVISLMLGSSFVFELPMLSFFLTKLGILTPRVMKKYRRYALVIILFFAAFLTPPDPVSQLILAVPLVLLYEISIFISKITVKKK